VLVSVLSSQLRLSAMESESLHCELDALRLVAPLSHKGEGEASPFREKMADVVAVHAPVAVPAASTMLSFVAHEKAFLVTTVASIFGAQEPEPIVAKQELLVVVEVQRSPSADGVVAKHNPRRVHCVNDEAEVAAQKARVVEVIVSTSPPPVPAHRNVSRVTWVAGEGWSDRHVHDTGFITIGRGHRRKGCGGTGGRHEGWVGFHFSCLHDWFAGMWAWLWL